MTVDSKAMKTFLGRQLLPFTAIILSFSEYFFIDRNDISLFLIDELKNASKTFSKPNIFVIFGAIIQARV